MRDKEDCIHRTGCTKSVAECQVCHGWDCQMEETTTVERSGLTAGSMASPDKVALWDAINRYVETCGGDPGKRCYGNYERMETVAEIEKIVFGQP